MAETTYDLLVVGSGPGGQAAAITAAKLGRRVGLIERKPYLGGVSLQTGTIPSKALREAAFLVSRFAAKGMREALYRRFDLSADFLGEAIERKNAVVDSKESALLSQLLHHGITIIPGEASFVDPHALRVRTGSGGEETLRAQVIVLAAGSRPRRPPQVPFDKVRVLDSTSILNMRRLPRTLLVVGGGVIACEFATMFAPLGVKVTIIDHHRQPLAYLDQDVAGRLVDQMLEMGLTLHMETRVAEIRRRERTVELRTEAGERFEADCLLYALGRQPNYDNLAIEQAGLVADDNGWVRINADHQTAAEHIYIIGDLAGAPALASTAMEQGRRVARHAFAAADTETRAPSPMAIYTIPELSYIGETERQLAERKAQYVAGVAEFAHTARGQIIGDYHGMLKLLAERPGGRILGVHIIGEAASELIHVGQMAMACGSPVHALAANVFNYPTLAECYQTAAQSCVEGLADA